MTAVIHHGPPGSYKSFAIVQDVVIPALQAGRIVCTNIRGLNSIQRIKTALGIDLPESAKLICVKHDSEDGFEHMARFFQWAPIGALIVMDEGQRVYPTRLRTLSEFDTPEDQKETLENGIQRPATVENAFDQHRHMNWDIYISTTNIGKIHKEVRAVAEYGYRHREMSGVLPWWKNCWREFKHDPETSGKSISHYIGQPVRRKADPRIFECYQSTATGEAKGSNENKSAFNSPKFRIFVVILALALGYFIYGVSQVMHRFEDRPALPDPQTGPAGFVSDNHAVNDRRDPSGAAYVRPVADPDAIDRYEFFRKLKVPEYTPEAYTTFPESREWKLTGVIEGKRPVAFLRSREKTRTVELNRNCYFEERENGWLCFFNNEIVASYTGPDFNDIDQRDEQQASAISAVNDVPTLITGQL